MFTFLKLYLSLPKYQIPRKAYTTFCNVPPHKEVCYPISTPLLSIDGIPAHNINFARQIKN